MIPMTPIKPRCPTAYPNLKKRMAPRMVEMAVMKTGRVPKVAVVLFVWESGMLLLTRLKH
jgi:hypothetical protein